MEASDTSILSRPLAVSASEASIASQLVETDNQDSEMGSESVALQADADADEDAITRLLEDRDSQMTDVEHQPNAILTENIVEELNASGSPSTETGILPTNNTNTDAPDTDIHPTVESSKSEAAEGLGSAKITDNQRTTISMAGIISQPPVAPDIDMEVEGTQENPLAAPKTASYSTSKTLETDCSTNTNGIGTHSSGVRHQGVNGSAILVDESSQGKAPDGLDAETTDRCAHVDIAVDDGQGNDDELTKEVDDDEDMSSEISEGVDLQEELQEAFEEHNFSFDGNFYHSALQPSAPNPCLFISGLGLVGLPLSERDAKAIISCSTLAPFGHGERTVVDKDVRDTWEIEPSRISFANKQWEHYINKTVCAEVCNSLGVRLGSPLPKMELYKLLLYEKGSHFLPHQDTQKAEGMFATVIVILPSAYTGGQVVVSHASITKTVDLSPNSLLSTALLAWYTDVKHEVKEVTSGYRLALSYNLIHAAPTGVPPPCLPDISEAVVLLKRVLQKWRDGKYQEEPERNLVAYLLNHEYSSANLKNGLKALKGADLHRLTVIRPVAEELGFMVGLASLEHNISGCADDDGGDYYRRGRYDYYDEDEDEDDRAGTPSMMEVSDTTTTISGLVDLDGSPLVSVGKVHLDNDSLIPKDPFEDETPDDTDYEGYMGNGAGQLDYWYRRTVLVLIHKSKVDDVCYSAEGAPYAFRKLKQSSTIPPTADDRLWADRLLKNGVALQKDYILFLMDCAFKWKDAEMWNKIMKNTGCSLTVLDIDLLLKAWRLFSFAAVQLSFEAILARSTQLSEKINFIYNLRPKASAEEKDVVLPWCNKESDKVLSSYTSASVQDIPTILTIIRVVGLNSFKKIIMPNLIKKKDNYDFWISFMKSLRDGRQAILDREAKHHRIPAPTTAVVDSPAVMADGRVEVAAEVIQAENPVDALINECLGAAASRWSDVPAPNAYYHHVSQNASPRRMSKVDRVVEIIEQAIVISNLDTCRILIIDLLRSPGSTASKFNELYNPLIPRLRALLTNKNQDICSPPFVDFLQVLIGLYLRDILGKKGQMLNNNLRKIGCGCGDCNLLDNFILNPTTTSTTFRLVQARRTHLERHIATARDLCTYTTIRSGSPHGVQVTKLPAVVQASMWESRQKAAKAFLTSIGPDNTIARIMGARYQEVGQAISGVLSFGSARTTIPSPSMTTPPLAPTSAPTPAASSSMAGGVANPPQAASSTSTTLSVPNAVPHVAGQKRKSGGNLVQLGPVIDLTEEDSS
ncbi:hypothetical protein GALMADRAFT_142951 [Galerina marginata CBS 339.88]|uniref:Prolyl 4-hydroxylase alpha subunit Fe(2+) 2OG dioxygenase domain-containing protein n=1 Tax=Galerina marginata (strain CBS 339.88) TaxID=685588 RepID=A0A067T0V3_GALM3|nr:hypothetical protein GALMADRAFT_142951 [Galerina marginata CBS 339.88]